MKVIIEWFLSKLFPLQNDEWYEGEGTDDCDLDQMEIIRVLRK